MTGIRVTISAVISPGKSNALCQFIEKNITLVRGFKGCFYVGVFFDKDGEWLLLEEEWQSIRAHKLYINMIKENGVLQQLISYFASEPTIRYYQKQSI